MKQALFHRKGGGNLPNWETLSGIEDLLSGSIFECLSYLPHSTFKRLLRLATGNEGVFSPESPSPKLFRFWPNWSSLEKGRNYVQPDAHWILGEGEDSCHVIVEAKSPAGRQDPSQWAKEWSAFFKSPLPHTVDSGQVRLLAVGGIPVSGVQKKLDCLRREANKLLPSEIPAIRCSGFSWRRLLYCLEVFPAEELEPHEARIFEDMKKTLHFHGLLPITWFDTLPGKVFRQQKNPKAQLEETDDGAGHQSL